MSDSYFYRRIAAICEFAYERLLFTWAQLLQEIKVLNSEANARAVYLGIFLIYSLYSSLVFLSYHAMAPDETWFLNHAQFLRHTGKHAPNELLSKAAAYLNYGAIYWALLKLLSSDFIVRLFFLILFLSIPLLSMSSFKSAKTKLLILLLYLTFPFSFWSGKLVAPEILIVFLISLSIFSLHADKKSYAAFLLGLAAGIKITALPLVVLLAINGLNRNRFFKVFFIFLIGFWLANPFNLFYYIQDLLSTSQSSTITLDTVRYALTGIGWSWDGVLVGSLSTFVMPPLLLTILLLISTCKIPKIAVPCTIAIIGVTAIIIASPYHYGWYWFPIIPIFLYCVGMTLELIIKDIPTSKFNFGMLIAIIMILLANFFLNNGYITRQMGQKAEQIALIKQFPQDTSCIQGLINQYQPKYIVDKLEFSRPALFTSNLQTPEGTIVTSDFSIKISSDPTMILIGSRLMRDNSLFESILTKDDALYFYGHCGDFFVFTNSKDHD